MFKQTQAAPTCTASAVGPCPTINKISRTPYNSTIAQNIFGYASMGGFEGRYGYRRLTVNSNFNVFFAIAS